jgi:hypothetical protein
MEKRRPCGHPDKELEGVHLRCSQPLCERPPVECLVYLGLGIGDRLGVRVEPGCSQHQVEIRQRIVNDEGLSPDEVWHRPADLRVILDWYHDRGRICSLDFISIAQPTVR